MKVRISLFFLVLSSYCLLCLYFFIKSLIENYEEGVGFGLLLFIGACIVLLLEQAVIKMSNPTLKRVWIIETGIVTIIAVFYFLLMKPTLYLDVNKNVQWLVVVETKDETSGKIRDNFPKKRTITLDGNGLLLLGENERSMNGPNFLAEHWGGNKSFPLDVVVKGKTSTYVVYSSLSYNLKSSDVKEITKLLNERE